MQVKFPERIDPKIIPKLETILPKKPKIAIPTDSENVEEVSLVDVDMEREQAQARRGGGHQHRGHPMYMEEDGDEEDGAGGPGVQCASH